MAGGAPFRGLHRWVGWITLIVFLGTGQYMRYVHQPPVEELEPGMRMLFRSRHIYLLFAALLNLMAAEQSGSARPRWLGTLGSSLLLLSPVLLFAAFAFETTSVGAPTALSIYGVQAALAGILCRLLAGRRREEG